MLHRSDIMQNLSFFVQLISHNLMPSRSIQVSKVVDFVFRRSLSHRGFDSKRGFYVLFPLYPHPPRLQNIFDSVMSKQHWGPIGFCVPACSMVQLAPLASSPRGADISLLGTQPSTQMYLLFSNEALLTLQPLKLMVVL